jgi:dienelactone hydrolase
VDPVVFFRRVSKVPSLGVYFGHDQSNPPDSVARFRRALEQAGNRDVDVQIFPRVNHGAWVVDGLDFDPDAIERRDPTVFDSIAAWVAARVGQSGR